MWLGASQHLVDQRLFVLALQCGHPMRAASCGQAHYAYSPGTMPEQTPRQAMCQEPSQQPHPCYPYPRGSVSEGSWSQVRGLKEDWNKTEVTEDIVWSATNDKRFYLVIPAIFFPLDRQIASLKTLSHLLGPHSPADTSHGNHGPRNGILKGTLRLSKDYDDLKRGINSVCRPSFENPQLKCIHVSLSICILSSEA